MLKAMGSNLLCLVLFVVVSIAQTQSSRPERGTGSKGTQIVSEIDSINLQSGAVSIQIPLASLPPIAGGKLSYTLNAYYSSKLWNVYRSEAYGTPPAPGCAPIYVTETVGYEGGWKIGGGYHIIFRDAREDFGYIQPDSQLCFGDEYYYMQGRFFKPVLKMPDGSEHEMRILGDYPTYHWAGGREYLKNYYRDTAGGPQVTFNQPIRLYTVDGTYVTAVVNPPWYEVKSVIYLKDGTRVETRSDGQHIIDTNGNSIHLSFSDTYNFARDEQTGREIRWRETSYNGQRATQVEYQTVGGQWQTIWVVWGKTVVQGKTYGKKDWFPNSEIGECYKDVVLSQTFSVIREIIYPATEQGVEPRKYIFKYNSDETTQVTSDVMWACGQLPSSYTRTASIGTGELSEITTPTGAKIKYTYSNDGRHDFHGPEVDTFPRNVITKKELIHDGEVDTWIYDIDRSTSASYGSVTNPDGSFYSEHFYYADPALPYFADREGLGGLVYRTNQSGKILTERKWELLGGSLLAFGSGS